MPILIRKDKEIILKENENITLAAETLGIPFSCKSGICGMCTIDVLEGEENLSQLTEEEKNLGMGGGMRLACQCKIKKGNVKIE